MHELSIALELHRLARSGLEARGPVRLTALRVEVGELSSVEPDLLAFAWEAVVAGGPDEGAVLTVLPIPARQVCASCGEIEERQPGTWMRLCPFCGAGLRVEGGCELDLVERTFETLAGAVT